MSAPAPTVLIVGNPGDNHVGAHLMSAAQARGIPAELCDVRRAWDAPVWSVKAHWWFRGHRPARLGTFSEEVARAVESRRPRYVVTTGLAPLDARALDRIGRTGAARLNFLTDDPWSPVHRTRWFLEALAHYDIVFTPRRATIADLRRTTKARIEYLPFAYSPAQHFPEAPVSDDERRRYDVDVVFAGGADAGRAETMGALIAAGFHVGLHGGYWQRYRATRGHGKGFLNPAELRRAVSGARVNLCLVRRSNRDSHSMRSFEIPAMHGCMIAEDTDDHREIFGTGGDSVAFFRTTRELVDTARRLCGAATTREQMAGAAHARIVASHATYADRLTSMLEAATA